MGLMAAVQTLRAGPRTSEASTVAKMAAKTCRADSWWLEGREGPAIMELVVVLDLVAV